MEKVIGEILNNESEELKQNNLCKNLELNTNENEDIIQMYEPLELNIDEKYKFINEGNIFIFL